MQVEVTSVSTKGQVVIPSTIRRQLGIKAGSKLMVVTDGENLLMKPVAEPSLKSFRALAKESRQAAKAAGLTSAEAEKVVDEVRNARGH